MAKLVILTLEFNEAKALLKAAGNPDTPDRVIAGNHDLREAVRKLQQKLIEANPLEKRK